MRKLKSLRLVVVLSVIAGLLVAACGGADPTPTPAPTATSVPAPTATPAPTPTPPPPPTDVGVSRGGTLTLGDRGSSSGLEPILSRLPANLRWVAPMYTRLIQLDENDDLAPLLAETWSVEENGTRFTFNLRDSVTFHDGTPLTAEDVAYSWDKMANPPEGTSSLFSSVFGPIIDTIAAPDATTVVITTTNTVGWFLGHVPVVSIVPKHAHEPVAADGGFTDTGLGSGPFVFESYTPKVELVMTANPDYFEAGLPFLDEIRWPFIAESQAMIAALISGRLLHSGSTDLTQEQVDAIKAQLSDLQVYTAPRGITIGIGFNHNNPNLANPKIREALVIAMDERDIIDVAYPGGVFPGTFFPGAGRFGIPEDEWNDYAMYGFGKSRDERLEMAKQMLDEAGATDLSFYWISRAKSPHLKVGEAAQDLLRRIGVEIELEAFADQASLSAFTKSDPFDIVTFWGGVTAFGEPEHFLSGLWSSEAPAFEDGGRRPSGYSNPRIDELLSELKVTIDIAKRMQITQEADRLLLQDAPSKQFGFLMLVNGVGPQVRNLRAAPLAHSLWLLRDVWIDTK